MEKVAILNIKKEKIIYVAEFAMLIGVALLAPLSHSQAITGSIVNATIFTAVLLLGSRNAILVALIPSLVALFSGTLPSILAPMVPFIMTGNIILIFVFGLFKKKNYWIAVAFSSILKFLFLFLTSKLVINLFLAKDIAPKIATMMSFPQLFTALAGGAIAYLFLKSISKDTH